MAAILDVGVNTRTPELIAAYPHVPHYLFEPASEFSAAIAASYATIDHRLFEVAIGASEGGASLEVSCLSGEGVTHSAIVPANDTDRAIQVTTLDVAVRDCLPGPYLLKIDIDGQELRVLAGAAATLPLCSVVIVEVPVYEFTARLRVLEAAGFRLFDLSEPCYYDGAFWQCDAIFLRDDVFSDHFRDLRAGFEPQRYQQFRQGLAPSR